MACLNCVVNLAHPTLEEIFGYEMTTSFMLMHLSYHPGQINYIRRKME